MSRWLALSAAALLLAAAAARAAPPLEAYGRLPAVEDVALSPSGNSFALIATLGDSRKLIVVSGGQPVGAADVGRSKVRSVWWVGEDHVLVETSNTVNLGVDFTVGRAELSAVTSLNLRTHTATTIFDRTPTVAHTVVGNYGQASIGGHWYGYFGGITYETAGRDPGDFILRSGVQYPDLYRVDLDSGEATLVAHGSEITDDWVVGPDGAVIARETYDTRSQTWEVRLGASGGRVLASGHSAFGGAAISRGRTPDSVLIQEPESGGKWEEVSLSTGQATPVPDAQANAGALIDPATGLWIGVVGEGDDPAVTLFDRVTNARVTGAREDLPGRSVRLDGWSPDLNRMIVFTSGGADAGTYWLVDIPSGAVEALGHAYPTIHPADVGPIRMFDWKAADGLELHGVLSLPPGRPARNLPVIVMPHGGPEARDYPVFDWWAQAFVSLGYAVFQPNFRGSDGYGITFRDAGFGQFGRKMQTDISDGLAELARQGIVDPRRACIVGASYGGYAALAGVTLQHGLYRCAVSVGGISDLMAFESYINTADDSLGPAGRYWRDFVGQHPEEVSPIRFARAADAPILLIHGKDDTVVPIDQSRSMEAALRAAGKTVQLVTLPSEDHWLSREDTRELMLKSAVAFVETYDPPDPAPAPTASR